MLTEILNELVMGDNLLSKFDLIIDIFGVDIAILISKNTFLCFVKIFLLIFDIVKAYERII